MPLTRTEQTLTAIASILLLGCSGSSSGGGTQTTLAAGLWSVNAINSVQGSPPSCLVGVSEILIDANGFVRMFYPAGFVDVRSASTLLETGYQSKGSIPIFRGDVDESDVSLIWQWFSPTQEWELWRLFMTVDPSNTGTMHIDFSSSMAEPWIAVASLSRKG